MLIFYIASFRIMCRYERGVRRATETNNRNGIVYVSDTRPGYSRIPALRTTTSITPLSNTPPPCPNFLICSVNPLMLPSLLTSHSSIVRLWPFRAPVSDHSLPAVPGGIEGELEDAIEALDERAVAITVWPKERSLVVNSRPIPRVAPIISQVCGILLEDAISM